MAWLAGYNYRKAITINHTKVSADLSYFPVEVKLVNDTAVGSHALATGYDIRFTSFNGSTLLSFERTTFSITNGQCNAVFWVKVPAVSASADTVIYLYYGNAGVSDGQNQNDTWDSNFLAVYHLDETPSATSGVYKDSTATNYDSTNATNLPTQGDGVIDKCAVFNGSKYIEFGTGSALAITGAITISCWAKLSDLAVHGSIVARGIGLMGNGDYGYCISFYSTDKAIYWDTYSATVRDAAFINQAITDNNFHFISVSWDGTTNASGKKLSIDGGTPAAFTSTISAMGTPNYNFIMGKSSTGARPLNGSVDEVHVSNIARSSAWTTAEYNNQSSPGTFYTIAAQEISSALVKTFSSSSDIRVRKIFSSRQDVRLGKIFSSRQDVRLGKVFSSRQDIALKKIFSSRRDVRLGKVFSSRQDIALKKIFSSSSNIRKNAYSEFAGKDIYSITDHPGTGYQALFNVTWKAGMNADFSDLRFSDVAGNVIPYCIESKTDSDSASVWIKLTAANIINVHYGNASATSESDGNETFDLYEDCSTTLDTTTKWTHTGTSGTSTIVDGVIQIAGNAANTLWEQWISINGFSTGVFEYYAHTTSDTATASKRWQIGTTDNAAANYAMFFITTGGVKAYNVNSNGTTNTISRTSTLTSYTLLKLVLSGSDVKFYENGTLAATSETIPVTAQKVVLGSRSATEIVYVDWIRVRKYSATEPVFTLIPQPSYTEWTGKDTYTITNNPGAGYQSLFTLAWKAGINNDFSDIRFSDDSDNIIPYWIISKTDGVEAKIWIKHTDSNTLYVHYGNSSATSESNIDNVMEFGDTFPGTTLNSSKWTSSLNTVTYTIDNGLKITDGSKSAGTYWIYNNGSTGSQLISSWTPISANYYIEYTIEISNTAANQMGQAGVALIGTDTKLSVYNGIEDESGAAIVTTMKYGFVEGSNNDPSDALTPSSQTRNFRILRGNNNNVYIYQKATTATNYTLRTVTTSTDLAKMGVAVGAYGGYPYLNYIKITNLYVRKYIAVDPTFTFVETQELLQKVFSSSSDLVLCKPFTPSSDVVLKKAFTPSSDIWLGKPFSSISDLNLSKEYSGTSDIALVGLFSGTSDIRFDKIFSANSDISLNKEYSANSNVFLGKVFSAYADVQLAKIFSSYSGIKLDKIFSANSDISLNKGYSANSNVFLGKVFSAYADVQLAKIFSSSSSIILPELLDKIFSSYSDIQLGKQFSANSDIALKKTFSSTNDLIAYLSKIFSSSSDVCFSTTFRSANGVSVSKQFASTNDLIAFLSEVFESSSDILVSTDFISTNDLIEIREKIFESVSSILSSTEFQSSADIRVSKIFSSVNDIVSYSVPIDFDFPLIIRVSQNTRTVTVSKIKRRVAVATNERTVRVDQ